MLRLDNKKGWFRLWVVMSLASIFPVHAYLYNEVKDYPYHSTESIFKDITPLSGGEDSIRRDHRFLEYTSECITKPIILDLDYYEERYDPYQDNSIWVYRTNAAWECVTTKTVKSYLSFLVIPGGMLLLYASIAWVRSGFLDPSSGSIQSPRELRTVDPAPQGHACAEPADYVVAKKTQPETSAGSYVWVYLSVLFFALRAIADLLAWFSLGSTISLLLGGVMLLLLLSCFQKRLWRVIRPIAASILILSGAFNLVVILQVTAQLGADISIQMIPNIVISILPIVVGIYVLRAKAIDALVASAEAKSP